MSTPTKAERDRAIQIVLASVPMYHGMSSHLLFYLKSDAEIQESDIEPKLRADLMNVSEDLSGLDISFTKAQLICRIRQAKSKIEKILR